METIWTTFYTAFVFLLGAGVVALAYRKHFGKGLPGTLRSLPGGTRRLLTRHLLSPLKFFLVLVLWRILLELVEATLPEVFVRFGSNLFTVLFIAAAAWIIIGIVRAGEDVLLRRHDLGSRDNLKARKMYTQMMVFGRLASIAIGILAFSLILLNFEEFRRIGTGLLASVGVAGIIIGLAAQRTVGTLLAGIQLAIAQPIRLDDVLVVEGEWGRVEEITFTYVVIRIWDSRRLVLPTTYFLEKPFQNWTRVSSDLLGTVYLYLDYGIPLEELRQKLHEFLEASPHWDGRAWALQVTDCSDKAMEVRALMSAKDSGSAWELRCEIREKLLEYLRKTYPDSLPRIRLENESTHSG
ncbi:MAG: mechanosensitive ion channel family protein [Thermovirgaceae bacterium]